MLNITKIIAEQLSVDPCRFCNRNAKDNFQIIWKFLHWLNANQNNRCCPMFKILLKNHIPG